MFSRTSQKLLFLLLTMLVGFGSLTYYLFKHQDISEHDIKTLYFGYLLPVSNLKELLLTLERDVTLRLYETRVGHKSTEHLGHLLTQSDKKIMSLWQDYATKYKSNKEKAFISQLDLKMQSLHQFLIQLSLDTSFVHDPNAVDTFITFSEGTKIINKDITELIKYELDYAHAYRKDLRAQYKTQKMILFITITVVLILLLILFIPITNSIRQTEKRLKVSKYELEVANKELHEVSIRDGLTNLYNRRYFDEIFQSEILRSHRERVAFSFIMLDIDHFKKYNDYYGHPAGDEVIKKVAQHLKKHFKREGDLIFRLGGEEFGVIATETDQKTIISMANELIEGMFEVNIPHIKSSTKSYVTLSLGLIHYELAPEIKADELYELADGQLYKAKESGRNQFAYEVRD